MCAVLTRVSSAPRSGLMNKSDTISPLLSTFSLDLVRMFNTFAYACEMSFEPLRYLHDLLHSRSFLHVQIRAWKGALYRREHYIER